MKDKNPNLINNKLTNFLRIIALTTTCGGAGVVKRAGLKIL